MLPGVRQPALAGRRQVRHAHQQEAVGAHQRDGIGRALDHAAVERLEVGGVHRYGDHAVEHAVRRAAAAREAEEALPVDAADVRLADVQAALLAQVLVERPARHVGGGEREDEAAVAVASVGADDEDRVDVVGVLHQALEELVQRARCVDVLPAPARDVAVDGGDDEVVRAKGAQRVLGERLGDTLRAELRLVPALAEAEHRHQAEDGERHADGGHERQPRRESSARAKRGHR